MVILYVDPDIIKSWLRTTTLSQNTGAYLRSRDRESKLGLGRIRRKRARDKEYVDLNQ